MTAAAPVPAWPADLAFRLDRPGGSVWGNLARSAARHPDRPAIHYYGTTTTYAALLAEVEALAGFLHHACGIRRGDRVLLFAQNAPQFIAAFQAILRADAVVVPANPMALAADIAHVVRDSGARVAFVAEDLLERVLPLVPAPLARVIAVRYRDALRAPTDDPLPEVMTRPPAALPPGGAVLPWARAAAPGGPACPAAAAGDEDIAVMPYTSGSTGPPKACLHPHATVMFTAVAQARWYRLDERAVMTAFMPLFHVAGMQASMAAGLFAGAALVVTTRWDRALVARLFARHRVTFWSAAPTMIADVMADAGFDEGCFADLTVLTGGGSPMPEALAGRLRDRFGLRFCEGYGLTETIAPTHLNPLDDPRPQCLGIPIQETAARVADPATGDPLPDGQVGEIWVSGPQVMRGYWNAPEADAAAFVQRDGRRWLRTGDLGRRDAAGFFTMVDRLKRMINVSGYKVSPGECEALLYRHPAVRECCVIAVPDPHSGEAVRALVVPAAGAAPDAATAAGIIAWARGQMAAYKVPRTVVFVDSLPRTGSNKIDWRALQEAARAGAGGG
jgi:fatty-acyl-CoA synthase